MNFFPDDISSGDPTGMSLEELEARGWEYVYGEQDFSELPTLQPGPLKTPEGHPDLVDEQAEWDASFADLVELAGRVNIVLAAKFATAGEFTFDFDLRPDNWIEKRLGIETGVSRPGFWCLPDVAGELLVAWRTETGQKEAA